jgi:hypothetical protein
MREKSIQEIKPSEAIRKTHSSKSVEKLGVSGGKNFVAINPERPLSSGAEELVGENVPGMPHGGVSPAGTDSGAGFVDEAHD